MFKKSNSMLFFFTIIFSSLLIISSISWIMIWIGLEINLISFISLMSNNNNKKSLSNESSIIYFIIQTISSIIFLLSIISMLIKFLYSMLPMTFLLFMLMISMMIKIGSAPFHFWIPLMMENLNWNNNFLLMTWQKLAPFTILFYYNFMNLILMFVIFSSFIGAILGLNQTSLKKIMAYSSINQTSWLLTTMMINFMMWKIYFLIYSLILFNITFLFNFFNIFILNQLFNLNLNFKKKNNFLNMILFFSFMSTSGLPPFLGFFPKLMIIYFLIKIKMFILITILIIFSLITMFFYIRISYSSLLINFSKNLNIYPLSIMNNKNLSYFNFILIFIISFISNFSFILFMYLY